MSENRGGCTAAHGPYIQTGPSKAPGGWTLYEQEQLLKSTIWEMT